MVNIMQMVIIKVLIMAAQLTMINGMSSYLMKIIKGKFIIIIQK